LGGTIVLEHPSAVDSFRFSDDNEQMVTICADSSVRVWDVKTGKRLFTPLTQQTYAADAAFRKDTSRLYTSAYDRVIIWRLPEKQKVEAVRWPAVKQLINPTVFDDIGDQRWVTGCAVAAVSENEARLFSLAVDSETPNLLHDVKVVTLRLSPNGTVVASRTIDHRLHVWNAIKGSRLAEPQEVSDKEVLLAVRDDGTAITTSLGDNGLPALTFYSGARPRRRIILEAPAEFECIAQFDEHRVLTWPRRMHRLHSEINAPRMWSVHEGKRDGPPLTRTFFAPPIILDQTSGDFVSNQALDVVVGSLKDGSRERRRIHHKSIVSKMAAAADGTIATTCEDQSLNFWNGRTGERIGNASTTAQQATMLSFSPDSKLLATSGLTSQIWDAAAATPVTTKFERPAITFVTAHPWRVKAFYTDGDGIRVESRLLSIAAEPIAELRRQSEGITLSRIDSLGRVVSLTPEEVLARLQ
jgi:WD40 repeat protein